MKASFRVIQRKFITGPAKMLFVVLVFKETATSCPFKMLLHNKSDNY